ncbi:MAG: hypothetical protein RR324_09965 [Cellulosilyticaceae bacterium]
MIALTDEVFNADGRTVEWKLEFYFSEVPLTVTRDNYLASASLIEEMHADGASPIGGVTANQVTLSLINEGGIFSPTNPLSPYYGKMKKGLKVTSFIRVVNYASTEEYDWEPFGVFYVTNWTATITGLIATVLISDILYDVFGRPQTSFEIQRAVTYSNFYNSFFTPLGITALIDSSLTTTLAYAFINLGNKEFLSALSNGAQADCFCNHAGVPQVEALFKNRTLRATLTDADQIKTVESGSSSTTDYDGVTVICNTPQESSQKIVLTTSNNNIPANSMVNFSDVLFSTTPLIKFIAAVVTPGSNMKISNILATPNKISFRVTSTNNSAVAVEINIHGTVIETVKTTLSDNGDNMLTLDSAYVQDLTYAQSIKTRLEKFVNLTNPILKVTVRGNPLLKLGDKIRVISTKYNLDYTGIIVRATYDYDGSLSSVLTLMDASIFEEVTP